MAEDHTGTSDPTYNLFAVVHSALEGAEAAVRYAEDAERDGDDEARDFLREVQQQNAALAERGKQLVIARIGG